MRFAVCSDEPYPVNDAVARELVRCGHTVVHFGSLATGHTEPWAEVGRAAAEAIVRGECDEGIFFCWTGTGIAMAANKVPGIRAALCTDPETARGARVWNHANVLALSNRLITAERACEILDAWLNAPADDPRGEAGVQQLETIEKDYRRR